MTISLHRISVIEFTNTPAAMLTDPIINDIFEDHGFYIYPYIIGYKIETNVMQKIKEDIAEKVKGFSSMHLLDTMITEARAKKRKYVYLYLIGADNFDENTEI